MKMNYLKNIKKLLTEYLETTQQGTELEKMLLLINNKDLCHLIYEAFFSLIADPTQNPEVIIQQLDTYTNELNGFSTNRPIQTLISFACTEALALRKPKILQGPWETLIWIIVKYSEFPNTVNSHILTSFRKTSTETPNWIIMICSQELCPNPCLRLELLRFIINFNCKDLIDISKYQKLFQDKVIITLFEICNNFKSLTVDQLPNFSPMDLQFVMNDNDNSTGFLMNSCDFSFKRSEIIALMLKLTSIFALLEKEKQERRINDGTDYDFGRDCIDNQLASCSTFCGMIPFVPENVLDVDECMLYFVQVVSNDSHLMTYMIEALDTITKVSDCFPEEEGLQDDIIFIKGRLLHRFFKHHITKSHKYQYLREISGGNSQAIEYRLRYLQNEMLAPETEFESVSAFNENYYRSFISGYSYLDENVSDGEDILDDEDVSYEEDIPDEVDMSSEEDISEIDT